MNLRHIEADFGECWPSFREVQKRMIQNCRYGGVLVELGAWKGRSSAFWVVEAKNKSEDIQIHIVDTWLGSPEHTEEMTKNLYEKFLENMKPLEGLYMAHRMTTDEAAGLFHDGSLDGVFIDADHTYEAVKKDIENWMPKIRKGGILAGHDYNNVWPGVIRAVNELLGKIETQEECWIKIC